MTLIQWNSDFQQVDGIWANDDYEWVLPIRIAWKYKWARKHFFSLLFLWFIKFIEDFAYSTLWKAWKVWFERRESVQNHSSTKTFELNYSKKPSHHFNGSFTFGWLQMRANIFQDFTCSLTIALHQKIISFTGQNKLKTYSKKIPQFSSHFHSKSQFYLHSELPFRNLAG